MWIRSLDEKGKLREFPNPSMGRGTHVEKAGSGLDMYEKPNKFSLFNSHFEVSIPIYLPVNSCN